MAWIEGSLTRTFTVSAPYDEVVAYFADPNRFMDANEDVESIKDLGDNVFKFTLKEKAEKGIKFQGIYDVRYSRDGDRVTWETVEGNTRTSGSTRFVDQGAQGVEVTYTETISPDLPIPAIMSRVFAPIVSREVSKGIGTFLDRSKELLEANHGKG